MKFRVAVYYIHGAYMLAIYGCMHNTRHCTVQVIAYRLLFASTYACSQQVLMMLVTVQCGYTD